MSNMTDYLRWRGDITLEERPLNDVDALVLATVSYLDFDDIVPILVLEEYERAKARGAKIYAELAGFGMSGDASHITAPNVDGPRRAMQAALRDAGLNADELDYINTHGTVLRSEERRVGKECRSRWSPYH